MKPTVSVLTPTYNHERYLGVCVESLLIQSFPSWEMIIINDGSHDNTANIAASFAAQDKRIRVINQENKGILRLAETYNLALELSSGKYICILEGDDFWEKDKLKWQVEAMEKNPSLVMAWGRVNIFHSNKFESAGSFPKSVPADDHFNNEPTGKILNILLLENPIPAVSVMIRREKLLECGGFIQNFGLPLVDLPTWLELSKQGPFHYDNRLLGYWRVYEFQTTKTFPVDIVKGRRDLCLYHFHTLNSFLRKQVTIEEPDLLNHYKVQLLVTYANSGRYRLLRKDFKGARSDYKKAIFFQGFRKPLWRIRAIIGYVFSLFNTDVEGLSRLLGKESLK